MGAEDFVEVYTLILRAIRGVSRTKIPFGDVKCCSKGDFQSRDLQTKLFIQFILIFLIKSCFYYILRPVGLYQLLI